MASSLLSILRTPLAYWRGLLHLKRRRPDQAWDCFRQSAEQMPDHAESWSKLGIIRCNNKEWEAAFPYVQKALFLRRDRADWQARFRQLENRLGGEPTKSFLKEEEIRAEIERHPQSGFLHSQLARHFRSTSKWWLQVGALRDAVKCEDSNAGYHFRLGEALEMMKRHGEAAEEYKRAVALADGNPLWHYKAGYALSRMVDGGDREKELAEEYYQAAVAHPQNAKRRHLGVGAFHQRFGRWQLAAEAYEKRVDQGAGSDDGDALFQLGFCQDRMYRWERAQTYYERAVATAGCQPEWQYRLGFVRERQGKFDEAAVAYRAAAESVSKPVASWYYRLGYVLAKAGNHEAAGDCFIRSYKPGDDGGDMSMEWLREQKLPLAAAERIPYLRARLEDELELDASDFAVWWRYGNCLELEERWGDAAEAYRQSAMRMGKHQPEPYHRLGLSLRMLGRHQEASAAFVGVRPIQRAHGLNKSLFRGDASFRNVAVYTEYYEMLPLQPKTVLYESFNGKAMSCNPYALFLRLLEDPARADWTHVWSVNDMKCVPERFKRMRNVIFVIRGTDGFMRHLASAGLLINNVTFHPYFIRRKGQIYLNTWHGTPWKTLGRHVRGEPFIYGNISRNFLQATHILSSNKHTTDALVDGYDIASLSHGAILEAGYPRIDLTINASEAVKSALRKRLGIEGSKKVVLYAPTWRGSHSGPDMEAAELGGEIRGLMKADCHLLFRGHTLSDVSDKAYSVPEDVNTNELLAIVDILITDYSSIWFDFLATGRPILFYLKDLEQYEAERGLYFGVEDLPGPVSYDFDSLSTALQRELHGQNAPHPEYEIARRKFCPFEDGGATRRVLEAISSPSPHQPADAKPSILMFGGMLMPNGITSSLLNLVESVDRSKLRLTLMTESGKLNASEEDIRRGLRLAAGARILPRVGRSNLTHEEKWIQDMFREDGALPDSAEIREIHERSFVREYRRLLGDTPFDAAVDFEGYNTFWVSLVGCAPAGLVKHKSIYQHNDLLSECRVKYPNLLQIFQLYRYYDRIASVSEMTMKLNLASLSERFGIAAEKFVFAENVLNPAHTRRLAEESIDLAEDADLFGGGWPVFVTIGRLSIEKDHRKLIRAFAKILKRTPAAKLIIVGDGPLRNDLAKLVERRQLRDSVKLPGFRENPFPYLKRADCFVLSSNHEGQPMVLLEAMVLEKPIVATDIPGSRGVVAGRSGHLVENSVDGLVAGLRDFVEGRVSASPVDMDRYRDEALHAFYTKVCEIDVPA